MRADENAVVIDAEKFLFVSAGAETVADDEAPQGRWKGAARQSIVNGAVDAGPVENALAAAIGSKGETMIDAAGLVEAGIRLRIAVAAGYMASAPGKSIDVLRDGTWQIAIGIAENDERRVGGLATPEIDARLDALNRFLAELPPDAAPLANGSGPAWKVSLADERGKREEIVVKGLGPADAAARALSLNSAARIVLDGNAAYGVKNIIVAIHRIVETFDERKLDAISDADLRRRQSAIEGAGTKKREP
jgi:hypothetical protein